MKTNQPLVAIRTLVYNHSPFLRDYFEGIIMQQTNFPFIAVIHDDCSTDGSTEIIHEYAARYPDIIRPIYEEVNCYQNGDWKQVEIKMQAACNNAKYIAFCEGDDYWTDPLKLQKQVDVLEQHPEYIFCCHRYKILHEPDKTITLDYAHKYYTEGEDLVVTPELQSRTWLTKVLSMMIRIDKFTHALQMAQTKYGTNCNDTYLFYELLQLGNGLSLNQFMGIYRQQEGGIWTSQDKRSKARSNFLACEKIYVQNTDDPNILRLLQSNAILYLRQMNCFKHEDRDLYNDIRKYFTTWQSKLKALIVFILPPFIHR